MIYGSVKSKEPSVPEGKPLKKPLLRIFVVDDHPIMADVLAELLNRSGEFVVVGSATNGTTALKQLESLEADIVILDVVLPGMGGLEVADWLRVRHPTAKVVMCSGMGTDRAIMEAFARGATAYVEKAQPVEELFSTLRAVAAGGNPLSSRIGSVLTEFVRHRKAFKSVTTDDMSFLRGIAQGHTLKQIALELGISESGVYKARARIRSRLNIKSPIGFFEVALSLGLVHPVIPFANQAGLRPNELGEGATSA